MPNTSCTGICFTITMLQYYICLGIVLSHFSIRVRVRDRVWYYFIFRDRYMK